MPLIRKTADAAPPAQPPAAAPADARWAAARAAATHPDVADLARSLALEDDARVREAIFTALARIATPESVLAVLPYVRSDDANLRTGALDALRAMPALVGPHLPELLTDPDSDVRLLACDLARGIGGDEVAALLGRLVETDLHPNVCAAAVEVLAEIGNADSLPALARCAERFAGDPFLGFAIKAATSRLGATPTVAEDAPITAEEYRRLCDYLYRRTGMTFDETRRYFVDRRVAERMAATAATSFASYFARLRSDLEGEVEQFINAFTVNETYFYREEHQLKCLTANLLAERLKAKAPSEAMRIWSVPCSTGEEPYSIAMWLLENWPEVDSHDVEIVGSDIDTAVLAAARQGLYGARALMRLTPQLIDKYFSPDGPDRWQILNDLRDSVRFTPVNLVERAETRPHGLFDVIFCRNVLIYFDEMSRRVAAENLYENLAPGGYICLGHAESMSRISSLFEVCRFDDAIVYRRPPGNRHG